MLTRTRRSSRHRQAPIVKYCVRPHPADIQPVPLLAALAVRHAEDSARSCKDAKSEARCRNLPASKELMCVLSFDPSPIFAEVRKVSERTQLS